jgi:hypothetical protein
LLAHIRRRFHLQIRSLRNVISAVGCLHCQRDVRGSVKTELPAIPQPARDGRREHSISRPR